MDGRSLPERPLRHQAVAVRHDNRRVSSPRPFLALPAYLINGIGVALGIGVVQALAGALGGPPAALAAASGAVYASLADLPNPPRRAWRRVLAAALAGCTVSTVVGLLRPHPVAIGVAVGLVGYASAMALAWGPRAGPLSFVGILAFVFTMATPALPDAAALLARTGWTILGAGCYLAWAVAAALLLRRRWHTLALADAVQSVASLLRSRAALLAEAQLPPDHEAALRDWIARQSGLDEKLQAARDHLFDAPDRDAAARRRSALLLLVVGLRETLLSAELDLDLLGNDELGTRLRAAMHGVFVDAADALAAMAEALRPGRSPPPGGDPAAALARFGGLDRLLPPADPRARLLPALRDRARDLVDELRRMQALMRGAPVPPLPLTRDELQSFVSDEGWPFAALGRHIASLRSPVTRHAVRLGAALACAHFIGLALPWGSHPYWLVLSVGVVLRGTLEQTLARRNARVVGTAVGCLIVLALVQAHATGLAAVVFLVAAGTAHAFVGTHYGVASTAASVMALLQAQMAHAFGVGTVVERLADTLLGALLAWGFSYVLPSWERQGIARTVERVEAALAALAREVLQRPAGSPASLRLARRDAYEALGSLAAAAQRSRAEPQRVRLAVDAIANLHAHAHTLLAQLSAVKVLLSRRADELDPAATERALLQALPEVTRWLTSFAPASQPVPEDPPDADEPALPEQLPARALLPWLERRLRMATLAAARVHRAAQALRAMSGR